MSAVLVSTVPKVFTPLMELPQRDGQVSVLDVFLNSAQDLHNLHHRGQRVLSRLEVPVRLGPLFDVVFETLSESENCETLLILNVNKNEHPEQAETLDQMRNATEIREDQQHSQTDQNTQDIQKVIQFCEERKYFMVRNHIEHKINEELQCIHRQDAPIHPKPHKIMIISQYLIRTSTTSNRHKPNTHKNTNFTLRSFIQPEEMSVNSQHVLFVDIMHNTTGVQFVTLSHLQANSLVAEERITLADIHAIHVQKTLTG
jgi:hypothetical protein